MQNFNRIFKEQLIKEIPIIDIGIFPGKFKPPHRGHFKTAKVANKENKIVFVLISDKEHEGVTADISLEIWSIYKRYLANIEPYIVTGTPVAATYELLSILNNGQYKGTRGEIEPSTNILDVTTSSTMLNTYLNKGNNFIANLYSSPEDASRYRNAGKEPFSGNNVTKINFQKVDRSTSATLFRHALKSQNNLEIARFLPEELSEPDKKQIINILRNAKF